MYSGNVSNKVNSCSTNNFISGQTRSKTGSRDQTEKTDEIGVEELCKPSGKGGMKRINSNCRISADCKTSFPLHELVQDAFNQIVFLGLNLSDLNLLRCVNKGMDTLCNNATVVFANQTSSWSLKQFLKYYNSFAVSIYKIDFSAFKDAFYNAVSDKDCETILRNCPNIKDLTLSEVKLTNELVETVGSKKGLESLSLNVVARVTSENITKLLERLKMLKQIGFVNCFNPLAAKPTEILNILSGHPNIKKISMSGVNIKDPVESLPVNTNDESHEPVSLELNLYEINSDVKSALFDSYQLTLHAPKVPQKPNNARDPARIHAKIPFNLSEDV